MSDLTGRKAMKLGVGDKKEIGRILRSKDVVLREYKRARILDLICSGYSHAEAALQVGVCVSTSRNICKRYMEVWRKHCMIVPAQGSLRSLQISKSKEWWRWCVQSLREG